ncbi:unnamed protein product [Strongylus vulgaris]|uniref:Uncharacterized protein n=1 Tax=Strongylus vulgaris TaxID=40348 RepID=A0A3P7JKG1_STRVU|nr:unnamed protein product [Strongylus vulgaris]
MEVTWANIVFLNYFSHLTALPFDNAGDLVEAEADSIPYSHALTGDIEDPITRVYDATMVHSSPSGHTALDLSESYIYSYYRHEGL